MKTKPAEKPKGVLPKRTYGHLFLAAALFWVPILIFLKLVREIRSSDLLDLDIQLLSWLHQHSTPMLDLVAIGITTLGSPSAVVVITAIGVGYLYYLKRHRDAAVFLFAVGGAAAINIILKLMFQRIRPSLWEAVVTESSYSFPSGHAMVSSALAMSAIAILWPTRYRWPALGVGILYALSVSLTRPYLGVHFPSDIVAGWCVSVAWMVLVWTIIRRRGRQMGNHAGE